MENALWSAGMAWALPDGRAIISACCVSLLIAGCNAQQPEPVPLPAPTAAQPAPVEQAAPLPPPIAPEADAATPNFPAPDSQQGAALTYRIIDAPNGTFGYEILSDGRLFVHQANLPSMPGNEGCKTKADAEKLADYVIEKIKKGEMPPTVTPEELKTLGMI